MRFIGKKQILFIHRRLIEEYGGEHGLRDDNALMSALLRPMTTVMGRDAYPTLFEKAAALGHSIIRNHPFVDGNKRCGLMAMMVMIELNGRAFFAPDGEEAEGVITRIAENDSLDIPRLADWLERNTR